MTFTDFSINPVILKNLEQIGYVSPSPIQQKAIPEVLKHRDLFGCAQTGTGKTAAFAVPILHLLEQEKGGSIRCLILTPTRELAIQIFQNLQDYGKGLFLKSAVVFGGVGQAPQVEALKRGVDILVATPGRLNDLFHQGYIDLSHIEIFVLDEADRMLDMGFIYDVKRVIAQLPEHRQNLMFSATLPKEILGLVNEILVDPVKIEVAPPATTVEQVNQSVYYVDKQNKENLLIYLLKNPEIKSALVFSRTKHGADKIVKFLTRAKISAAAIHGNKSQSARQMALSQFKNHRVRVLVATDIAARGIDIDELTHVINYDIPEVPETYVHRIGRTARAGHSGSAISFCDIDEKADFRQILKLIRQQVPEVSNHPWPMQNLTPLTKAELRQRQELHRKAAQEARRRREPGESKKFEKKHSSTTSGKTRMEKSEKGLKSQKGFSKQKKSLEKNPKQAFSKKIDQKKVLQNQNGRQKNREEIHSFEKTETPRNIRFNKNGRAVVKSSGKHSCRPELEKYLPKPLRSRPNDQPLHRHQ